MCITNLASIFIEKGFVVEEKLEKDKQATTGPRPILLKITPGRFAAIGIHVTEDRIRGMLVDVSMGLLHETSRVLDYVTSKTQMLAYIKDIIDECKNYDCGQKIHIVAIGITDRNYFNRSEGSVNFRGNSLGIDREYIKTSLDKIYNLPIYIENEHVGMLLTEMAYNHCDIDRKYYFINISREISGAFATRFYFQLGSLGLSGQVGHMSINCDGPKCKCGNRGCYDQYGSIRVLLRDSNCTSIEEFNNNLSNREPQALHALEGFIQASAVAITNIINLYDPEVVIIVGEVLRLDPTVLIKIEYLVNNRFVFRNHRNVQLLPSRVNENDYCRGTAVMAYYKLLHDNSMFFEKENL